MTISNHDLVATCHQLSKRLSGTDAAMVEELATRLDCALAATRAACSERDAVMGQMQELAAENSQMLRLLTDISENHGEFVDEVDDYLYASVPMDYVSEVNSYVSRDVNAENPFKATDRFIADVTEMGRMQGINFAASRLAAAFNHGFIDKPLKEVGDVVRMILDAKADLTNGSLTAADGLSGEYAEQALKDWEEQLRGEEKA